MTSPICIEQKEMVMATQPNGGPYVVIAWDIDGAPDAVQYLDPNDRPDNIAPYYEAKRREFPDLRQAKEFASSQSEEGIVMGASVFCNKEKVARYGDITFEYRDAYNPR